MKRAKLVRASCCRESKPCLASVISDRRRRARSEVDPIRVQTTHENGQRIASLHICERRSKSAARGGVGRPVEKCSAQLCSGVGQENRGGAAISPYRERGTRSVCSDGDVD
jgi:hypothetical protein